MKFETSSGNAMSARAAWHEAFVSGIRAIDYVELANGAGVQYTARGSDNCTMDHCDKGKIQQAVFKLKHANPVAWAWGMFAYAPDGAENKNTLINTLIPFCFNTVKTEEFNPYMVPFFGALAVCAIHDAAIEDCSGSRMRRKAVDMAALLWGGPILARCNDGKVPGQRKCALNCKACRAVMVEKTKEYERVIRPMFFIMKDSLKGLSAIALPPVATVLWTLVDKANGEVGAVQDLSVMLKTPITAA